MRAFATLLVLAATALAAPQVAERQNTGCFGAGRKSSNSPPHSLDGKYTYAFTLG